MTRNIPEWINNLALQIYEFIKEHDAFQYFQDNVKQYMLDHLQESQNQRQWEKKRKQHFEEHVATEDRLQNKEVGPPERDWVWDQFVMHKSDGQSEAQRTSEMISGWTPPELSISAEPKITHLLPLSRDRVLSLTEKCTVLAAVYDSVRKGTDQIPPWKWPDLSEDISSDEMVNAKMSMFFYNLCMSTLNLPKDNEGWIRAFLKDIEKDIYKEGKKKKKNESDDIIGNTWSVCGLSINIKKLKSHPVWLICFLIVIVMVAMCPVWWPFVSKYFSSRSFKGSQIEAITSGDNSPISIEGNNYIFQFNAPVTLSLSEKMNVQVGVRSGKIENSSTVLYRKEYFPYLPNGCKWDNNGVELTDASKVLMDFFSFIKTNFSKTITGKQFKKMNSSLDQILSEKPGFAYAWFYKGLLFFICEC